MKVAFDNHMPPVVAKLFIALATEGRFAKFSKHIELETANDYAPSASDRDYVKSSDVPWLDRFARAGGHAVISGDVKMRQRVHERLALYENGFVVIFFDQKWGQWDYFHKSALMLHWWKEIYNKIRTADRGTFWQVPIEWPTDSAELKNVSFGLAKILKDNPNAKPRKIRKNRNKNKKLKVDLNKNQKSIFEII